jgi:hypothetical protein
MNEVKKFSKEMEILKNTKQTEILEMSSLLNQIKNLMENWVW